MIFNAFKIMEYVIWRKKCFVNNFNKFDEIGGDFFWWYPASIYLFKVNSGKSRKSCEIYTKFATKIPERLHWRHCGVFIVNSEQASCLFQVFISLHLGIALFARYKLDWKFTEVKCFPRKVTRVLKFSLHQILKCQTVSVNQEY